MKKTICLLLVGMTLLSGCAAVGLTALGVGMATGVSHTLSGIVYKTFSTNQGNVKRASLTALNHMHIKGITTKKEKSTEIIIAKTADREIEIELEAITDNTTRMSATAKVNGGIMRDSATATEIIIQTEKLLGPN
jgi:Protein of unknown function (DUF3568)